eukprot:TRINITY_DN49964_c0_g1_i1.p1 TRINITY_DN49964_c0_g1~~TRINITY_DN49964_c0_g1_i1.p1  ORF type:complete len:213 (+),score=49.59 TRINITY_DN49964_c0_g1_i1:96-641(+)
MLAVMLCLVGRPQAADLSEALAADEACNSDSGDCTLQMLQMGAEQKMEEQVPWGDRETGSSCMFMGCDSTLGPIECHHWRCICKEGYKYTGDQGGACIKADEGNAAPTTTAAAAAAESTTAAADSSAAATPTEAKQEGDASAAGGATGDDADCAAHSVCSMLGFSGKCCPTPAGKKLTCCS